MAQFIVSLIGPDRPGLLKSLASKTHARGGKWLSSKVSRLGGQFAGIIHIDIAEAEVRALQAELQQLPDFQSLMTNEPSTKGLQDQSMRLIIDANDRPGIVNEITHLLDSHSINVDSMECHRLGGNDVGTALFTADAQLTVPAELDQDVLINELEALGQGMDISLRARRG